LTPPSTYLFFRCCWECFKAGVLLEIDQKLAAAQFDQFVRGERIQRATRSFDIVSNQLPTLRHPSPPSPPALIHEIKQNANAIRSPTPRIVHDPQHAFYPRRRFTFFVTSSAPPSNTYRNRFTPYPMHRRSRAFSFSQR
jgi:hypothetical protein